jgi:hypothetical protein
MYLESGKFVTKKTTAGQTHYNISQVKLNHLTQSDKLHAIRAHPDWWRGEYNFCVTLDHDDVAHLVKIQVKPVAQSAKFTLDPIVPGQNRLSIWKDSGSTVTRIMGLKDIKNKRGIVQST